VMVLWPQGEEKDGTGMDMGGKLNKAEDQQRCEMDLNKLRKEIGWEWH
jgi:hypothetical protein